MSLKMKMAAVGLSASFLLVGCDGLTKEERWELWREQKQNETFSVLEAFNVSEIEMPKALYDLRNGVYEITVKRNGKEQDCIANVISTHSPGRQVILTNCR